MATLNIDGVGSVTVDDSFLKLSPEDQAKTVDEIVASHKGGAQAAPPPSAPKQEAKAKDGHIATDAFYRGVVGSVTPMGSQLLKLLPESVQQKLESAARGLTNSVSFGFNDEIGAGIDTAEDWVRGRLKGKAAADAYADNLKAQRDRDAQDPGAFLGGQVAGMVVPGLGFAKAAKGLLTAAKVAPTAAKTAAVTGSVLGGLNGIGNADGDLFDRVFGGTVGAVGGAVLGGGLTKVGQTVLNLSPTVRAAGMRQDPFYKYRSEIIQDLAGLRNDPLNSTGIIGTAQKNALAKTDYLGRVRSDLSKAGVKLTDDMQAALNKPNAITLEQINALRASDGGDALADALIKYRLINEMTKPTPASGGITGVVRVGAKNVLPGATHPFLDKLLGPRVTTEQQITKITSPLNVKAAVKALGGEVSPATESAAALAQRAKDNLAAQAVAKTAREASAAAKESNAVLRKVQDANTKAAQANSARLTQQAGAESQAAEQALAAQALEQQAALARVQQANTGAAQASSNRLTQQAGAEAQATEQALAARALEEQAALARVQQANAGAAQANSSRLTQQAGSDVQAANQAATAQADAQMQALANNAKAAQANSARLTAEAGATPVVVPADPAEAAWAAQLAANAKKAQANSARLTKQAGSSARGADDAASLEVISRMGTGDKVVGGGPLGRTAERFSKDYGLSTEQTIGYIRQMREGLDDEGKKVLDSLLENGKGVPHLVKLQDRVAEFIEGQGVKRAASEGVLSSGIANPVSYKANVDNAMGALSNATKNAPTPELAQFAHDVAAVKDRAGKVEMLKSRLDAATDPAEIDYLSTLVTPITKFGKK